MVITLKYYDLDDWILKNFKDRDPKVSMYRSLYKRELTSESMNSDFKHFIFLYKKDKDRFIDFMDNCYVFNLKNQITLKEAWKLRHSFNKYLLNNIKELNEIFEYPIIMEDLDVIGKKILEVGTGSTSK